MTIDRMRALEALRTALEDYRSGDAEKKDLQDVLRRYLSAETVGYGNGVRMARKLGISPTQLANLKYGHRAASPRWIARAIPEASSSYDRVWDD